MVCSQFIIFEFEQNPIRTVYDKKHSYKGYIYQLQQHAYFENQPQTQSFLD